MVDIVLKNGQTGYDVIAEYIYKYWRHHNLDDTVIISLGASYDGKKYDLLKEIASPAGFSNDIEFDTDWWEGQEFIRLYGIKGLHEIDISGGIYTE